jgi:hypothetical protein
MSLTKPAVALAILAAGGVAFLALGPGGGQAPGGSAAPVATQAGGNGIAPDDEARAVAAVRAHLRQARATGEMSGVTLYPLARPDEVAVCGTLDALPVVARVLLTRADAAGIALAAREGRVPPSTRAPMVILEAGPGLPRGAPFGGPWERYCRGAQPAPRLAPHPEAEAEVATGAEAPVLAVDRSAMEAAQGGLERVAVVSPVRVRSGPNGSAEILAIAQRGRVLTVHERAPGGWLMVGEEGMPVGWAHSSLLEPAP